MFDWLRKSPLYSRSAVSAREAADRLIADGNRAEKEGRLREACELYRSAVKAAPGYAKAHLNLGIGLEAAGDAEGALQSHEAALATDPGDAYANYNLAKLLYARGDLNRAEHLLRVALERKPEFPEARVALANVYDSQGNTAAAADSLKLALQLRPDYAGAWYNYGVALWKLGQPAEAETALRRTTQLDPAFPSAHNELGKALTAKGELDGAAACFRKAISLEPAHIEAHTNLGTVLWKQGRLDEVIACYRGALLLAPGSPAIHYYLGNALMQRGRSDHAVACYQEAVRLKPDFLDAHYGLGATLRQLGRHDEATVCFDATLKLIPDSAEGYYRLAHAFRDADRCEEALDCLQKALSLNPEYVEARWAFAMLQLPAVHAADDDPVRSRAAFSLELDKLDRWFDATRIARGFETVGIQQPFLLAYEEENNRDLLQRYGKLCARLMAAWPGRGKALTVPRERSSTGAVRVGVVSWFFSSHSVWSAIVKGWFGQFERERVALHAFYLRSHEDQETQFAMSRAAHFESGAKDLRQWVEAILGQRLDVLIYPEIGMDPMTLKLASLRLAPVQVAAWGHPETSGLPTIDYYLSAADFEPADAQSNYSERLVALPHLGCYYSPKAVTPAEPELEKWSVDPDCALLLCPGVPFKYAPRHDGLLAEIAHRLGRCRFIFFTLFTNPNLSQKLRKRFELAFARKALNLEDFVTFIPWQNGPQFYGWLKRAEVFLDTIGFSGFNTAMHAVECGLPIVTREGRFLRGRFASGILKRIGLQELVAGSDEEYVALAVRLCRDPEYRRRMRGRMEAGRHLLFEDVEPIRAMEAFLARAAGR
jgi:predicted O-linked N-acetylglucosamine transferase (SPINDLY family)